VKREGRIKRYCKGWEAKVDNVDETKIANKHEKEI
jgi:hypothetical protein